MLATFNPPLKGVIHESGKPVGVHVLALLAQRDGTDLFLVASGNGRSVWKGINDVDLILDAVRVPR